MSRSSLQFGARELWVIGALVTLGCGSDGKDTDLHEVDTATLDLGDTEVPEVLCAPSSVTCLPDRHGTRACSEDGAAFDDTPCDNGTICVDIPAGNSECKPLVCTPNSFGCADVATASICDATGTHLTEIPCPVDLYCGGGVCYGKVCTPDSIACEGDAVVTCNDIGSTQSVSACADDPDCASSAGGCYCTDGVCVLRACIPGSSRCVGNGFETCVEPGVNSGVLTLCDADSVCLSGACVSRACTPDSRECASDTLLVCNSDGTNWSPKDCTSEGRICTASDALAACSDPVCTPNAVHCDPAGSALVTCDARGTAETITPCPDGDVCIDSVCILQCQQGWTGTDCQTPVCTSACQNGGACAGPNVCTCADGWTGTTCATPVCAPGCANGGTCTSPNTCICTTGWSGAVCETPTCAAACQHGGSCVAPNTCNCSSEWSGPTCQVPVCPACQNGGTCTASSTCTCPTGWGGPTCEVPICGSPCQHGGLCIAPNTCSCPSGWGGSTCGTPVCSPPCLNGGTCTDPNICACLGGWTGPTCAAALCEFTCQNGGTCTSPNTCTCPSGWTSPTCETPVCSPLCQNGGACIAPGTCACPDAWTGATCETPFCQPSCENGGTCISPNTCSCPRGWLGPTCATPGCGAEIPGLMLYYDFEQRLTDQSGAGRDATATTTNPLGYGEGALGSGLSFFSNPDLSYMLTVANGADLAPTSVTERTFAFWIKGQGTIIAQGAYNEGSHYGLFEIRYDGGNLQVRMRKDQDWLSYQYSAVPDEGWRHWAVTFGGDIGVSQRRVEIFQDGRFVKSGELQGEGHAEWQYVNPVRVGGLNSGATFSGGVDELRVYDHVLNQNETLQLACQQPDF